MKNKKLVAGLVTVTLVAVLGVGATLAYFTDKEEATNVITMGHVDIELTEPNFDKDDTKPVKDNIIENIVPGQTIDKDPTITLAEGSEDAYIRVKLDCEFTNAENKTTKLYPYSINKLIPVLDDENKNYNKDWVLSDDGYYYYQKVLDDANKSVKMFEEVIIPSEWGNDYADGTLKIVVNAEAIQKDNFIPEKNADEKIVAWYLRDAEGNILNDSEGNPKLVTAEAYKATKANQDSKPVE